MWYIRNDCPIVSTVSLSYVVRLCVFLSFFIDVLFLQTKTSKNFEPPFLHCAVTRRHFLHFASSILFVLLELCDFSHTLHLFFKLLFVRFVYLSQKKERKKETHSLPQV
uniref:Uncharacterized protein n=1 Tax=Cacopsylla melanoneura TaxID=428564 RepID=A0A8D8RKE8_9HEMI